MKNIEIKKPTSKEMYDVLEAICTVPNPWAFCIQWQTERPRLFNKFMDLCAWFRKDDKYFLCKVKEMDFMYNKALGKDVLVANNSPNGFIRFWDPETRLGVNGKHSQFSPAKERHY